MLLLPVYLAAVGIPAGQAIVGGAPVAGPAQPGSGPGGPPPTAASLFDGNGGYRCSAVVVAPAWVLTAAHCVADGGLASVRTGSLRYDGGGREHRAVEHLQAPPLPSGPADLALVRIDPPTDVPPAPLAAPTDLVVGAAVTIAGWGQGQAEPSPPAPELNALQVSVVGLERCPAAIAGEICLEDVEAPHGSACFGDSGGPAYVGGLAGPVLGVTSRGGGSGPVCTAGAVYSSVAGSEGWIRDVLGKQ